MNIMDYAKSTEPLEKREEVLFDTISRLDKDSFDIFKEVIDLNNSSLYRMEDLTAIINQLMITYGDTVKAFDYIQKIEENSSNYSRARFLLKILINLFLTAGVSILSPFLGIIVILSLNRKAIKEYGEEIKINIDKLDEFDENKLRIIECTLSNSERLLSGKHNKSSNLDNYFLIQVANYYIENYINGYIIIEQINDLNESIKLMMLEILSNELDDQKADLEDLLNIAKSKHNDEMRLINSYK